MKAVVIGCGRVGSAVALQLHREGWEVTAVDEKELTRHEYKLFLWIVGKE